MAHIEPIIGIYQDALISRPEPYKKTIDCYWCCWSGVCKTENSLKLLRKLSENFPKPLWKLSENFPKPLRKLWLLRFPYKIIDYGQSKLEA